MSETDSPLPDATNGGEGHAILPWIVPEPPKHGPSRPLVSLNRAWIWVIGAVAVVAAGTVLYEVARAATRPPEPTGVGLRIECQGNDLLLLWDAGRPAVRRAVRGSLSISDGSYKKQLDLDPGQLRSGRVFYSADTGDVLVQLDVVDRWGQHAAESTRVLGPARDTAPVQNASVAPVRQEPVARPPEPPPAPKVRRTLEPAAARVRPPAAEPAVRTSAAPSPSRAMKPAVQPAVALAPPPSAEEIARLAPQKPVAPALLEEPAKQPPSELPPAAPPQASAAQPAATAATVAGGPGYVGPKVLQRVNPMVPPTVRAFLRRDEVVRLMVSLDASGKVVAAQPASGNTQLAKLATNTLDQWRFEPAKLNGSNVPGDITLVFRFHTEAK